MPLPDGGAWPPPHLAPVTRRLAAWSAWYSGDPDQLQAFYEGWQGIVYDSVSQARVQQHREGWRDRLARWWWGQPVPVGEKRTKLHVPLASDLASISADLLFSEPPSMYTDHVPTQDRLTDLITGGMHAALLEGAEICAALGGVFLRVVWDREVADHPWLDPVHADAAVPEWRWGKLAAVTFWRVLHEDDQLVIRHLERHEPGVILHGLYQGTPTQLGRPIPLTEHEATAALADAVTDGNVIETGLDRLTAVYWPNMRPNRLWRNLPAAVPLGRSDYAGVEQLFDALDEVYSSWMRDIRLAKARILLPQAYLESLGPGRGAYWDADREAYVGLNIMPENGGSQITATQFAIRVDEHQRTAQDLIAQILRTAGYSAQTLGLMGDVAATATEVKARERRSFISRGKKIVYATPALQEAIETLLLVDRQVFGTPVEPVKPVITFGDSVSEDIQALAQTANILRQAEAASTETIVRLVHPDWSEEQIAAEVQRITADRPEPVPDPFELRPGEDAEEDAEEGAEAGEEQGEPTDE